jgi:stalled ribosome rescue protein Dom34
MLRMDPDRAVYGWSHVSKCAERLAIQQLLITDQLFRYLTAHTHTHTHSLSLSFCCFSLPPPPPLLPPLSISLPFPVFHTQPYVACSSADLKTRQRYVKLVEDVKANMGDVRIFSTLHVSGERIALSLSIYFYCLIYHHTRNSH